MAKMQFPKAKLEARVVNMRQWGVVDSSTAPTTDSATAVSARLSASDPIQKAGPGGVVSWSRRIGSINPVGRPVQRVDVRGRGGRCINSIKTYIESTAPPASSPPSAPIHNPTDTTTLAAAPKSVPGEVILKRIGCTRPAGMTAKPVVTRSKGGRRIGSINPANADMEAADASQQIVEIYNAGKPLGADGKARAALSMAKRAAMQENLRQCARDPILNPGLGQEWEEWEVAKK